jgi:glycosyltransferase involved in cell wall biosynthesis
MRSRPGNARAEMTLTLGSVWFDARPTQSGTHAERGIARYVAEHGRGLVRVAPEVIGAIGLERLEPLPPSLEPLAGSGLIKWHRQTRPPEGGPLPIYHVTSPFEMSMDFDQVWPAWARDGGSRLVVTLHDLIPLILYDDYVKVWGANGTVWMARLGLIRAAHQLVTNSENTARDAIEYLKIPEERVTVVHSGVSGQHAALVGSREEAEQILRSDLPKIRPGFLLYVGGDDARKNLDGTIRAYAQLPESIRAKHQLVIAFRVGPLRRLEIQAMAQPLGIKPRELILTGYVTDRQLAALYRACELFVFPSLYEGAGLPVLEAMSCGAPVAASKTTSIPELLGDLDATFDPADPADIARCVREVLEGPPAKLDALRERSRRRVELYTWERVAGHTIEGYERAMEIPLERRGSRRPGGRKRLAVITAWPGPDDEGSGHLRSLVRELGQHAEVEVVVSADQNGNDPAPTTEFGVRVRTDAEFDWLKGTTGYDRCLFVLGPSAGHVHALRLLDRVPGVVLLEDVRLLELYRQLQRRRYWSMPVWLEDKIMGIYGDRVPRPIVRGIAYAGHEDNRVRMTAEVQQNAERILVHSREQVELLEFDRGRRSAPIEVVPFAIPAADRRVEPGPSGPPLVVMSGESTPALLAAFAQIERDHPGARLARREELGDDELAHADLALRLQPGADAGRPSPEVAEFIAAGIPTFVSDVGWQGELPEPVVIKVPPEGSATVLADRMETVLSDQAARASIRSAQQRFAEENSFSRVAERHAELLGL